MASWIRAVLSSTLLAFCIPTASAQAAPSPIVFDFEDGLQGSELHGSALRVQTQILGGQWAIFGDGFIEDEGTGLSLPGLSLLDTFISLDVDLTGIASISVEQFFLDGDQASLVASPMFLIGIDLIENIIIGSEPGFGPFDTVDPSANPSVRTARLMAFEGMILEGVHTVGVHWNLLPSIQREIGEATPLAIVAFIDNITFHPVPEPSSWLLLSLGIAGVVMIRRKLPSRA